MPHKLSVVVTVGSPLAFQSLNGTNLLSAALKTAHQFCAETGMSNQLFVAATNFGQIHEATSGVAFEFNEINCDPNDPIQFAAALKELDFEMVAIHDAQRPLTRAKQFHRTLEGLFGCDAVRPAMAFTETLKAVNSANQLTHTIDRTKVRRVSSPEIIRRCVIDFASPATENTSSNWSLPLLPEARISEVEADPESLRINNPDEITLMEAFSYWQEKIIN